MLKPVSGKRRGVWAAQRLRLLGIVFLALLLVGVWLVYAVFTQKFTHFDKVTLRADRIGLQLPYKADVKIRGVEVGQVLNFTADPGGKGAIVTLGLDPSQVDTIPANVTGAILPKTLFGEKYVALQIPKSPSPNHIEPGAVIEHTHLSTEVEDVLSDLYPLLKTVQPAQLNETLNALATALEGHGEELGQTLVTADGYLKKINPQIPALVSDLKQTSTVADTYSDVLPEVAGILRHSITTATTLENRQQQLHTLFSDVDAFSSTANAFLKQNGGTLIQLGKVSAPVLSTLARYSPEFPCLLGGLDNLGRRVTSSFRNYTLHVDLETLPNQPRAYTTADKPRYGDDRGPACGHLPNPSWTQANPLVVTPNIDDGVDTPTGMGTDRAPASYSGGGNAMGYAGSPEETKVIDTLIAPGLGVSPSQVPDLGALLIGPMIRGTKVSLQ